MAARVSAGLSSEGSWSAWMSLWRKVALSSKLNLASMARTWPSGESAVAGVVISGLISAMEQSLSW